MKKSKLFVSLAAVAIVFAAAFKVINAENIKIDTKDNPNHSMKRWESKPETPKLVDSEEEHTVGWYVANMKAAHDQNKVCYDNPSIQATPNCVNSLHALEISFVGGSRRY